MTSMFGHRDITLLIAPLALYDNHHLNKFDFIASRDKLHRVPLLRLQHWAIEIGSDNVYEVTSRNSDDGRPVFRKISRARWWDERNKLKAKVQSRLIGVTKCSDSSLDDQAGFIWGKMFDQEYHLMRTNCQVFASLFWATIRIAQSELIPEKQAQLQRLPGALNPFTLVESRAKQIKRIALAKKSSAFDWFGWSSEKTESDGKRPQNASEKSSQKTHHGADSIPQRPTSRWLDFLHEEMKTNELNHKDDIHNIVRRVNERHNAKPASKPSKARKPPRTRKALMGRFSWFKCGGKAREISAVDHVRVLVHGKS